MSEHFWASSDAIPADCKSGGARAFGRKLRRRWSDWELIKICNRGRYQVNVDIKSSSKIYNFCGNGGHSDDELEDRSRPRQRAGTAEAGLKQRRKRRRRALSNIESFSKTYHWDGEPTPVCGRRGDGRDKYKTTITLEYSGPFYRGELVWFDPGVGHVLPGEVLEYHKPAQVLNVQAVIAGKLANDKSDKKSA
ncbi:hypothetical protein M8J77_010051 [Diaphorina citri]|nr:hypothetical protein M8J77_010051 [Diaphorina citri]